MTSTAPRTPPRINRWRSTGLPSSRSLDLYIYPYPLYGKAEEGRKGGKAENRTGDQFGRPFHFPSFRRSVLPPSIRDAQPDRDREIVAELLAEPEVGAIDEILGVEPSPDLAVDRDPERGDHRAAEVALGTLRIEHALPPQDERGSGADQVRHARKARVAADEQPGRAVEQVGALVVREPAIGFADPLGGITRFDLGGEPALRSIEAQMGGAEGGLAAAQAGRPGGSLIPGRHERAGGKRELDGVGTHLTGRRAPGSQDQGGRRCKGWQASRNSHGVRLRRTGKSCRITDPRASPGRGTKNSKNRTGTRSAEACVMEGGRAERRKGGKENGRLREPPVFSSNLPPFRPSALPPVTAPHSPCRRSAGTSPRPCRPRSRRGRRS